MAVSSSSIIHFTKTKEALEGILKNNFKLKYCLETICMDKVESSTAFPMVSFCDIPLSQVKEHIGKYGSYGLGLTKDWAKKQRLCPVQYVATGSLYALSLRELINSNLPTEPMKWSDMTVLQRSVIDVVRYIKNYEGPLTRNGKANQCYRFYDEREWRYVPEIDGAFPMIVPGAECDTKSKKAALNTMVSGLRLKFDPSDIKYIIVDSESEISEFVEVIRNAKGKSYSLAETERLTTRIITRDQIESDL
jgi:hypothetical protein